MRFLHTLCLAAVLCQTAVLAFGGERRGNLRVDLARHWDTDSVFTIDIVSSNVNWWQRFNDPILDSLVRVGTENNFNARAAIRRIEIARAELGKARAGYLPSAGVSGSYTYDRASGRVAGPTGNASTTSYYNVGATLNWEIDLFGRVRAQTRRAGVEAKISSVSYAGVITALQASIATAYIQLIVQRQQLMVAHAHAANQKHIVDIVETRYNTGLASKLDVAQSKTLYYSTIASIPQLEASIQADENALAVLLGIPPVRLPKSVHNTVTLPSEYELPAMGAPLDLLRRRPDIVEAELNIDAAAAELGIARSAYMPSLSISANAGTQAHRFGDLFSGPSFTWSVTPTISWTVFDGGQRLNTTRAARQALEEAVDTYNQTVLEAIEDVRNSMIKYNADLNYIDRLNDVLENARNEVNLSIDLYKQGLTVFSNVVDSQLNYLTYQNTIITARGDAITSLINLFESLGGGWQD